jgi:hypothetical protein
MLEELKKYLSETPKKQIAQEWEEMTKDAACNAPTIKELFDTWDRVYKNESIDIVSNKGDYVQYKGGSTSKLLIKGNKYRLTCSPFRDRIAIINEGGSRMNTLKKYFDC